MTRWVLSLLMAAGIVLTGCSADSNRNGTEGSDGDLDAEEAAEEEAREEDEEEGPAAETETEASTETEPDPDASEPDRPPEEEPDAPEEADEPGESTEEEGEEETTEPTDTDLDGLTDEQEAAHGCDAAKADTDRDGVGDGAEVAVGTDCADPLDSPPWEFVSGLAGIHPRLLAAVDDRADLQFHLDGSPLFQTLLAPVRSAAAAADPTTEETIYDPYLAVAQSLIAKNAAFLLWLGVSPPEGSEDYAAKAKRMLSAFDTDLSGVSFSTENLDKITIHTSEAMVYFSEAFDFLAASGALDATEYAALRARLIELGRQFFDTFWVRMPFTLALYQNNHTIKAATGIGMIGLLFPDAPESRTFLFQALSTIDHYHLSHQICPGGDNAEGPGYFEYTMINLRGFGLAWHRVARGEETEITRLCRAMPSDCAIEPRSIPDLLMSDPHRLVVSQWLPGLRLPNGYVANVDDSDLVTYNWGFDAYLYSSEQSMWLWVNDAHPHHTNSTDAVETLVLFDPAVTPVAPDGSSGLFAGFARLTTGSDPDHLHALLTGERDASRSNGVGHEQPDNQSFILSFARQMWIVDSGYYSYAERDQVAGADHHNVILVDGLGGPMSLYNLYGTDDDADLRMPDDPPVPQAVATLTRGGVELQRRLLLLDRRLALVVDRMKPADGALHSYQVLFHLNGGGTTDGTAEAADRGVTVVRGTERLLVRPNANPELSPPVLSTQTHSFLHSHQTHARAAFELLPTEAGSESTLCTTLSFTPDGSGEDPNKTLLLEPAEELSGVPWCWAAGRDDEGIERVYLWVEEPASSLCFALSRVATEKGGGVLGELCSDANLARLTFPAGGGDPTAEALGEGEAGWTPAKN